MEVAKKLARMVDTEWFANLFALDQDLDLAILQDRVVDLFPFFVPTSAVNSGTTSRGLNTS